MNEDSPYRQLILDYCQSPVAIVSFIALVLIIILALSASFVAPQNPYDLAQLYLENSQIRPGGRMQNGMIAWLGTDTQGRDMLSAIIYGLRTSLFVGILSALIALVLGIFAGLSAAYAGGRVDAMVMRIVDMQLSFPAILIGLILIAILGSGIVSVMIALIAVQWAYYARTVRGSALVERNKEYIEAARCLAMSDTRIVFRHLLPNCLPPLIVIVTVQIANSIALEASLSFLGVGLPVTEPSLGRLIANGFDYMLSGRYWMSFFPGIALLLTILLFNLVGDQLRDILNPRLKK